MPMNTLASIRATLTTCVLCCSAAGAADPSPELARSVQQLAATTCVNCHGVGGRSTSPAFPNLAAQTAPYLQAQLQAFRDQTRADPDALAYMWGMASQLSDPMIEAIAAYYSKQAASPGKTDDPKLIAQGMQVFQQGVTAQGVPACASCHGSKAQGNAIFPRLAGQHAAYLVKQMLVIQNALRAAPVMHGVIQNLSHDQMRAVAAYLQSLGS
jgi:cbb3-type cytochrome c oxidase subunit III